MKTAFICNVAYRWRRKFPLLIRQINDLISDEKGIFVVNLNQTDSTEKYLAKIIQDKFDRIVAAGGDGSLNRIVNYLQNKNCLEKYSLGIIPLGTCNDFARYLGFKSGKIKSALRSIRKNNVRKISFAGVNGHYFINNAGFGKRNPAEKKKNPISVIREMRPVQLKAQWQENVLEGNFFMMLCANAPYFSGGLRFSKKSEIADDILEFYFVKKMMKLSLIAKVLICRFGIPLHLPYFTQNILKIQSPKLTIHTEQSVSIVTDGEPVEELSATKDATFEIAGKCNFIVP